MPSNGIKKLKKSEIKKIRTMLQRELEEEQAKMNLPITAIGGVSDDGDRSFLEQEAQRQIRTKQQAAKKVAEISRCLQKIENGSYGVCDDPDCDELIDPQKLKKNPATLLCSDCQEEAWEKESRKYGGGRVPRPRTGTARQFKSY